MPYVGGSKTLFSNRLTNNEDCACDAEGSTANAGSGRPRPIPTPDNVLINSPATTPPPTAVVLSEKKERREEVDEVVAPKATCASIGNGIGSDVVLIIDVDDGEHGIDRNACTTELDPESSSDNTERLPINNSR
mmetsp:Transcript_43668/g.50323  ORF Transcript_43668/g.50323 Transcript_43668/m.50323 type:complete len:134 (-) Transcript_43668:204-605(-)